MKLIILGPQGSGKGTLAAALAKRLGVPHVDVGQLLRHAAAKGDAAGRRIKATLDKGDLLPAALVDDIVKARLDEADVEKGFILDGYPRELDEAEFVDELVTIDAVLVLEISDDLAVRRLVARWQCPAGGEVYGPGVPSKKQGVCDVHKVKLVKRSDDTPEAIRRRLVHYHDETEPLLEYYRPRDLVIRLDGSQKPDAVLREALDRLDALK